MKPQGTTLLVIFKDVVHHWTKDYRKFLGVTCWDIHPQHTRVVVAEKQRLPAIVVDNEKAAEMLAHLSHISIADGEDAPVVSPALFDDPGGVLSRGFKADQIRCHFRHIGLQFTTIEADVVRLVTIQTGEQTRCR